MKELGAKFKEKRQELDIPLAQARNETKIRMTYLKAIEEGNFEEVEQEVYLKGFLKIYANYLGLDERKIMQEYREYKKIEKHENEENSDSEIKEEQSQDFSEKIKKFIDYHQNKFLYAFMAVIILLVILAVLFLGTVIYKSFISGNVSWFSNLETYVEEKVENYNEQENNNNSNSGEEVVSLELNETEKTDSSSAVEENTNIKTKNENKQSNEAQTTTNTQSQEQVQPTEKIEQEQNLINLTLQAIGHSWCAVEIDGETVFRGAMQKGTNKKFSGKNIKLKISNGAGVKIIKDGQELGPFGEAGEVIVKEYSIDSD